MATIESGARFGIPLVFLVSYVFIATCVLVIFVRRWTAAKQSGGPFMAAFHIAKGIFYIHVAFCFKSVVFLYHLFDGSRLISCAEEKVVALVMSSSLNKRVELRPCSLWERARSMMR